MLKLILLFLPLLLWTIAPSSAQINGLWEVKNVHVGHEIMTPVAKWFQFNSDQTTTGGNGGIQNIRGSFKYDDQANQLTTFNENGVADEFGPFSVQLQETSMTWQREEEGQDVKITLKRVEQIPLAPWDQIVGMWQLEDSNQRIFIRWDRRYIKRGPAGNQRGLWHIHAHRPQLTLVSDDSTANREVWEISFADKRKMVWTSNIEGVRSKQVYIRQ